MIWLFWICVIGAVYSYALYPLLLRFVVPRRGTRAMPEHFRPKVTLVIACRNEEKRLGQKIENALKLTYEPLEIMVASDASDDASDEIVRGFANRGVVLIRSAERRGKEHAQGLSIEAAKGEIIVFSDAGTDLPPESVGFMVERFADADVGAVSSEDQFVSSDGKVVGEGAYVQYEMWLRRLESERAGLVGLSGSFFAVRRNVLTRWDATIPSDFACALMTNRAGLVAVSDPRVRGIYKDIKDPSKEYRRKVRTAIRGMAGLGRLAGVLNPLSHGWFAFEVFSHKFMRWMVPWFFVGALLASGALSRTRGGFYQLAFWLQLAGYGAILLAHVFPRLRSIGLIRLAYYFVQANIALAHAGVLFLLGKRIVVWEPSVR
jgi:glycosyltransferase involved in cell wall biosynthesis